MMLRYARWLARRHLHFLGSCSRCGLPYPCASRRVADRLRKRFERERFTTDW